jgi:hypothetical protein
MSLGVVPSRDESLDRFDQIVNRTEVPVADYSMGNHREQKLDLVEPRAVGGSVVTENWWRREELNRLLDSQPASEKVPNSPLKSRRFSDFSEDKADPKTAQKDLDNPEKPDRVRSGQQKSSKRLNSRVKTGWFCGRLSWIG